MSVEEVIARAPDQLRETLGEYALERRRQLEQEMRDRRPGDNLTEVERKAVNTVVEALVEAAVAAKLSDFFLAQQQAAAVRRYRKAGLVAA